MAQPFNYDLRRKWWLMRHLDPKVIDQALKLQNEQRMAAGQEAFVYVIPYQFVPEADYKKDDKEYNAEVDQNNYLRSTLHRYLFIKATEEEVRKLVDGEWNRMARYRLALCRSKGGDPLWASPKDMDRLMDVMIRHREMFNLVPAPLDYQVGDTVMLKTKMFDGYEFNISKFSVKGEGVNLTLEMPLFNGRFILKTKSKNVARRNLPVKLQQLLSPDFVGDMERGLIEILRRRYPRRKNSQQQETGTEDVANLNNYHFLSCMKLGSSPVHRHIRALLLLCAILRRDMRSVEYYVPIVEGQLSSKAEAASEEDAFMMAILYLATHEVGYRDAAKHYKQTHEETSDTFAQLVTVVKYIRFRTDAKKKISKRVEKKVKRQTKRTLQQIRECDFSRLSPQALSAIADILSLPPYDNDEGHALMEDLKELLETEHKEVNVLLPQTLRAAILRTPFPHVEKLSAYYQSLLTHYPDHTDPDAADLYSEYLKILLEAYSRAKPLTSSWWILKSIVEHYHHANRTTN